MKKRIVLGILIFISLFVITGCGTVKPLYDKNGKPVYIAEEDYDKLFTNADEFKGKFVKIPAKLFTKPRRDDNVIFFQAYTDTENYENDIIVYSGKSINVDKDDYVMVTGYVLGISDGKNAFGGSISAPAIYATKVEKSDYKEVVRPTIKEVAYTDKTINQSGYIISVDRVEFAEKETRVYVKIQNAADNEFDVYSYSAKIIQGTTQYDQDSNYEANYPEIQSELKPGIVSEGVLVFPPIKQESFKLSIGGYSGNWDIDLNDYVFDLEIK